MVGGEQCRNECSACTRRLQIGSLDKDIVDLRAAGCATVRSIISRDWSSAVLFEALVTNVVPVVQATEFALDAVPGNRSGAGDQVLNCGSGTRVAVVAAVASREPL